MKKVFLLAAASLLATAGFSQVRFGGQALGVVSSASVGEEMEGMKKSMKPGFGIGVVAEIGLTDALTLRPSLNYLQKGVKMKGSGNTDVGTYSGEMKVNMNYLELPVVLAYNINTANGKVFFGAGPSLGYGIGGKTKVDMTVSFPSIPGMPAQHHSEDAKTFKKEEDEGAGFKRFDFSANVIAGMQFNSGFFVNAGGLFGLSNIGSEDSKYRNIGAQLTVGFLLNNKK
ncbi:porin family protein [Aridibaculum aurantiacum]|uniref:porin family protein n=1 Tax=Aridibaculum aurantiacum TaxID=2810307 RepID=UPI001A9594A6|nr:porin family protein [Aridibaculum aurantiacum]